MTVHVDPRALSVTVAVAITPHRLGQIGAAGGDIRIDEIKARRRVD
jgi:hypothetical protein